MEVLIQYSIGSLAEQAFTASLVPIGSPGTSAFRRQLSNGPQSEQYP
jgi:hypothetical protein